MLVFSIESKDGTWGGQGDVFPLRCEICLYEFTDTVTQRVLSKHLTLGPSNALPVNAERGHFHLVLNSCVSSRGEPSPVEVFPFEGLSLQPTNLFDSQGTFRVAPNQVQDDPSLLILSLVVGVVTLIAAWFLLGSREDRNQNLKSHDCKHPQFEASAQEGRLVEVLSSDVPQGEQQRSPPMPAAEICVDPSGSSSDSDSEVFDSDTTIEDRHKLALFVSAASKNAASSSEDLEAEIQALDAELAMYDEESLVETPTRGANVHITADNDEELLDELAKRADENDNHSSSSSDEDDFVGTSPLPADNAAWRRWFDEHGRPIT